MLKSLAVLFGKSEEENSADLEHRLRLAAAALLIEMSRADYVVEPEEQRTLEIVLHAALNISASETAELVELAGAVADQATSLYEFTRLINDHYDKSQKLLLIQSLWRVAYADGDLDKYEERLIRQVSDLIHVSHKDFMRLKLKVADI